VCSSTTPLISIDVASGKSARFGRVAFVDLLLLFLAQRSGEDLALLRRKLDAALFNQQQERRLQDGKVTFFMVSIKLLHTVPHVPLVVALLLL